MPLDYNHVALFVRVVKTGSFTAAAAQAGVPKSSVSRSITRLEQEIGVRLLQRTTRKLALTEVGQAYFEAVSSSVDAIDEADAAARERGVEPRGTVRVTAPPEYPALAAAVAQFCRKYPGIRVEVSLTSRLADLVTEGFDLAVRAGRLPDSSLVARRIGSTEVALMASPAYLRRRGRPRTPGELAAHDFVLYRATGGRATVQLRGPDGEAAVEVTSSLVADDLAFCRMAVESGAGLALLPVHSLAELVAAGKLEQVLPEWSYGESSLFVVLPTARHVPLRVALLRDFLVEHLSKQLAETRELCRKQRAQRQGKTRARKSH
jgi:DNA-binding transcriptional LysR family regulator